MGKTQQRTQLKQKRQKLIQMERYILQDLMHQILNL